MAKKTTKRLGRPPVDNPRTARIQARLTPDEIGRLSSLADAYRVKIPDLIQWWVDEAISGQWTPAHLRSLPASPTT